MTKKFIEYLPLLTIVLIYFAYSNLYYYYIEFKVDIYNYISNSEILLSFLSTIVIVTALVGTLLTAFFFGKFQGEDNVSSSADVKTVSTKLSVKNKIIGALMSPVTIFAFLVVVSFLLGRFLVNHYNYKEYELRNYYFFTSFLIIPVIYYSLIQYKGREAINKYAYLLAMFLIFYIGAQIGKLNKASALEIKSGKSSAQISFKYNNQIIKTDTSLIYIGQTQSTLFIFNRTDTSTLIFKRENMDSLKFK